MYIGNINHGRIARHLGDNQMFIVTVTNQGQQFWLRGTTWAFHADRVNQFQSEQAARDALEKARKFMKPSLFKLCQVKPAAWRDRT